VLPVPTSDILLEGGAGRGLLPHWGTNSSTPGPASLDVVLVTSAPASPQDVLTALLALEARDTHIRVFLYDPYAEEGQGYVVREAGQGGVASFHHISLLVPYKSAHQVAAALPPTPMYPSTSRAHAGVCDDRQVFGMHIAHHISRLPDLTVFIPPPDAGDTLPIGGVIHVIDSISIARGHDGTGPAFAAVPGPADNQTLYLATSDFLTHALPRDRWGHFGRGGHDDVTLWHAIFNLPPPLHDIPTAYGRYLFALYFSGLASPRHVIARPHPGDFDFKFNFNRPGQLRVYVYPMDPEAVTGLLGPLKPDTPDGE
jgi:hypothetical protein